VVGATVPYGREHPEPATVSASVHVSEEVREAVADGRAVVALESTIISHGMPYPDNVTMATDVESIVRDRGAVPATIAVIDGVCTVGVGAAQIEMIASRADVHKATTRDLPWLVATKATGATTVAATMHLAALAGIRVFATGGIGGVHRGASTTFDISADLAELATTPVAVVCAGVKSILDIALTLEHLETLGVPVVVLGSDDFPSFYSRSSGLPAPRRIDSSAGMAGLLHATWRGLLLTRGVCIANPIAAADEIPALEIDGVISAALAELAAHGVSGQGVTPFLLSRLVEHTGGRSLTANMSLIRQNVAVATDIAVEYSRLPA
jgi:pseudouridine-5'-phosphate glycosidase